MNYYIINFIGIVLIIFVVSWFWLGKRKKAAVISTGLVEIKVAHGVYSPAVIQTTVNQPITLRFVRSDESPCAATVSANT